MTDVPEQFVPDDQAVIGCADAVAGELPETFDVEPRERADYFESMGFERVDAGDGVDCPDCGATMRFAKRLRTEPMDSDAKFTAYRCASCLALDWAAESDDVDPRDEMRGVIEAVHMRGRDK